MKNLRSPLSHYAFTLVEIVAVIAIMTILALLVSSLFDWSENRSRSATTHLCLEMLRDAIRSYKFENDHYPIITHGSIAERNQQLVEHLRHGLGQGGLDESHCFVQNGMLYDGWGNPLYYAFDPSWPHAQYFLISMGGSGLALFPDSMGRYNPEHPHNLDNISL